MEMFWNCVDIFIYTYKETNKIKKKIEYLVK